MGEQEVPWVPRPCSSWMVWGPELSLPLCSWLGPGIRRALGCGERRDWAGQKPDSSSPSFIHPETVMRACSVPHPERYWEADLSVTSLPPALGEDRLENRQIQPKIVSTRDKWSSECGGRIRLGEEGMPWKDEMIRS